MILQIHWMTMIILMNMRMKKLEKDLQKRKDQENRKRVRGQGPRIRKVQTLRKNRLV